MRTLYFALFHSHLNFQILSWGAYAHQLFPLQKKAIRVIHNVHPRHHTDPLFLKSGILKLEHIYDLSLLRFYQDYEKCSLPEYLQSIQFRSNSAYHSYETRAADELRPARICAEFSRSTIRNAIPKLINSMSHITISHLSSSKATLNHEFKKVTFQSYNYICAIPHCYSCSRNSNVIIS